MTIDVNGVDVAAAAQIAAVVGSIVSMLVIGLLVYLLVRPPRHVREARRRPAVLGEDEVEQMLGLIDRMEQRLEVLERALAGETERRRNVERTRILEAAGEGRDNGRNI